VRDPRFALPELESGVTQERSAIARLLGSAEDRRDLEAILQEWWTEALARAGAGEDSATEEAEHLRRKCASLQEAQAKLGTFACSALARHREGLECRAGAFMLGTTAAAVLRNAPNGVDQFDRAVNLLLLARCWPAIEVMMDGLDQEPRWPADPGLLSHLPRTLDELVGETLGPRVPYEILLEGEQEARSRGLLEYLWGYQHEHVDLDLRVWCRLALLARRDWGQLAAAAETLPIRELREALWWRLHLLEDRAAILALLRSSASVFTDGAWTGSTVALTALKEAVTHADQLHLRGHQGRWRSPDAEKAASAAIAALEQEELPRWFAQVMQMAHARPDGRALMLFFASWLVEEMLRPGSGRKHWSSAGLALSAMTELLRPLPAAHEMKESAQLGLPKNADDRRHAVALVTGALFGGDERAHWNEYRSLLSANDEGLCWQAKLWRRACCYDALAQILDRLPGPLDEWRSAWKSLFVTDRERARFDVTSQGVLLPSVHLVRVGVALLRRGPGRDGARAFYRELRGYVRKLIENDVRLVSPLSDGFVTEALDVAPAVFGETWPETLGVERLILATPEMQVYAVGTLLDGGAPMEEIEAALELQRHQLVETIRTLETHGELNDMIQPYCQRIREALRALEQPSTPNS